MTLEKIRNELLDFLDDIKLRLSCLGFVSLEFALAVIIGGATIVSCI